MEIGARRCGTCARDHSLSPCLRAALQLQGAGVESSGVMCALEGGTPAAASAQTLAYQIVWQLGMRLRHELKLRGGGGKCKKKSGVDGCGALPFMRLLIKWTDGCGVKYM